MRAREQHRCVVLAAHCAHVFAAAFRPLLEAYEAEPLDGIGRSEPVGLRGSVP
jgi:hypothetical protein